MIKRLLEHATLCGVLALVVCSSLAVAKGRDVAAVVILVTTVVAGVALDWWGAHCRRGGWGLFVCEALGIPVPENSGHRVGDYMRSRGRDVTALLFALLVPILPVVGPHMVPLVTALWVTSWYVHASSSERAQLLSLRHHLWILPLGALIAGSVVYEVSFITAAAGRGVYQVNPVDAFSVARSFLSSTIPSLSMLSRVVLIAVCVGVFTALREPTRRAVQAGLLVGTLLSGVCVILEYAVGLSWTQAANSSFWQALHRLSGTFSDPNALGVWMVLIPFVAWGYPSVTSTSRMLSRISYVIVPAAGLLSGSRTFILGGCLALLVLGMGSSLRYTRRRIVLLVGAISVSAVAVASLTDWFYPWIDVVTQEPKLPEGIRRGLALLSVHRVLDNFHSRSVFNQLGVELVRHFPFFGVGADRFRYYVSALAMVLGLPLGRWIDNSNNFYLGIWSELGLVGVAALLYAFVSRRLVPERRNASIGVIVLIVLLLTGPHLDFPEITLVASFLIAEGSMPRACCKEVRTGSLIAGLVGWVAVGCCAGSVRELGVYRCNFDKGTCRQWIAPAARIWMECSTGEPRSLRIDAPYVPRHGEMVVTVEQPGFAPHQLRFSAPGSQQVPLQCHGAGISGDTRAPYSTMISLWSRPGWSPARDGTKRRDEERWLGVVIEGRTPYDLLPSSR